MSCLYPNDPLIKELKGYTSAFLEMYYAGIPVTDAHPLVLDFEGCLENIFYCGINARSLFLGYVWDGSPWYWIEKTDKSNDFFDCRYQITQVIASVKSRKNVLTTDGKFRLALRYCLVRKCLNRPLEYLKTTKTWSKYYMMDAIIADEILLEIFLSVIYQLNIIDFKLDLENSALLDFSWELPIVINVELVPTADLGVNIGFSSGKAIILDVRSNSILLESRNINIGDIIENINGQYCTPTVFSNIHAAQRCTPTTLTVVKAIQNSKDCRIHPAMLKLYKDVKLDVEAVRESWRRNVTVHKRPPLRDHARNGFKVTYCGSVLVGRNSDVKAIDKAYATLWAASSPTESRVKRLKREVLFEVGELGVRISALESKSLLERHMFMEISACSGVTLVPNSLAYIAGKGNYNVAQDFRCYFFTAPNHQIAVNILQLMGQGFRRTCYAV